MYVPDLQNLDRLFSVFSRRSERIKLVGLKLVGLKLVGLKLV